MVTTLPWALYAAIKPMHIWNRKSQTESGLTIHYIRVVHGLYYVCSVANPLIYAIRMKKFRKAEIKGLPCKRSLEESRHNQAIELDAAWRLGFANVKIFFPGPVGLNKKD